jgi:hypothetical protein
MVIYRLPAELAGVVRRLAHYPHGLGFLHQAWIDSVAVTPGVHPFAVDATRALLETPRRREELIEAVQRERGRPRKRPRISEPSHAPRLRAGRPGVDRRRTRGFARPELPGEWPRGDGGIGDRVRLEFRRVREDGGSGILCYGYELVPVRGH